MTLVEQRIRPFRTEVPYILRNEKCLQIRRIVDRALKDFREDAQAFGRTN